MRILRRIPLLIGVAVGMILFLVASQGYNALKLGMRVPEPLQTPRRVELDRIPAESARVLSGTPNFRASITSRSYDGRTDSGVFAADGPSRFVWRYQSDESIYIMEGSVEIEYAGRRFTLNPGDAADFRAGTSATWYVPRYVKKAFSEQYPGRLARWTRSVLSAANLTKPGS